MLFGHYLATHDTMDVAFPTSLNACSQRLITYGTGAPNNMQQIYPGRMADGPTPKRPLAVLNSLRRWQKCSSNLL